METTYFQHSTSMCCRIKSPLRSRVLTAIEELHLPALVFAIDAMDSTSTNYGCGGYDLATVTFPDYIAAAQCQSLYICGVCDTLPRFPAVFPALRSHTLCVSCALNTIRLRTKIPGMFNNAAPCPTCRHPYYSNNIERFSTWNQKMKDEWNLIKVKCPW